MEQRIQTNLSEEGEKPQHDMKFSEQSGSRINVKKLPSSSLRTHSNLSEFKYYQEKSRKKQWERKSSKLLTQNQDLDIIKSNRNNRFNKQDAVIEIRQNNLIDLKLFDAYELKKENETNCSGSESQRKSPRFYKRSIEKRFKSVQPQIFTFSNGDPLLIQRQMMHQLHRSRIGSRQSHLRTNILAHLPERSRTTKHQSRAVQRSKLYDTSLHQDALKIYSDPHIRNKQQAIAMTLNSKWRNMLPWSKNENSLTENEFDLPTVPNQELQTVESDFMKTDDQPPEDDNYTISKQSSSKVKIIIPEHHKLKSILADEFITTSDHEVGTMEMTYNSPREDTTLDQVLKNFTNDNYNPTVSHVLVAQILNGSLSNTNSQEMKKTKIGRKRAKSIINPLQVKQIQKKVNYEKLYFQQKNNFIATLKQKRNSHITDKGCQPSPMATINSEVDNSRNCSRNNSRNNSRKFQTSFHMTRVKIEDPDEDRGEIIEGFNSERSVIETQYSKPKLTKKKEKIQFIGTITRKQPVRYAVTPNVRNLEIQSPKMNDQNYIKFFNRVQKFPTKVNTTLRTSLQNFIRSEIPGTPTDIEFQREIPIIEMSIPKKEEVFDNEVHIAVPKVRKKSRIRVNTSLIKSFDSEVLTPVSNDGTPASHFMKVSPKFFNLKKKVQVLNEDLKVALQFQTKVAKFTPTKSLVHKPTFASKQKNQSRPNSILSEIINEQNHQEVMKYRMHLKETYQNKIHEMPQKAILMHTYSPKQKIQMMANSNKYGVLPQQNERTVNFKKQNQMKKALEIISKQRTPVIDQDKITGNVDEIQNLILNDKKKTPLQKNLILENLKREKALYSMSIGLNESYSTTDKDVLNVLKAFSTISPSK